ncbi:MAG TPA: hypothetical protein ENO20_10155 [Bacteroides sp.]|nr:hypothetical protein [Bacteroides sp.]
MKATKLFTGILLVAMATSANGQVFGSKDHTLFEGIKDRLFPNRNQKVEYLTVDFQSERGRIEIWISDLHSWAIDLVSGDVYEAPVISRTILVDHAEVVFESDLRVEQWMGTPFETGVSEDALTVEGWMAAPFEEGVTDNEVVVEDWMAIPFPDCLEDHEIAIEDWMITPFETGPAEEEVSVEDWMTAAWTE